MGNTESKFRKAVIRRRNRHSPTARAQSEIPEVGDQRADGPAQSEHINEIGKLTKTECATNCDQSGLPPPLFFARQRFPCGFCLMYLNIELLFYAFLYK